MSPFEQILRLRGPVFKDPTISFSKSSIGFNKTCEEVANLSVMKAVEIFWDDANRVVKLKVLHIKNENSFLLCRPSPSSSIIHCVNFIKRVRPTGFKGILHAEVRWDEREKSFIGTVPKGK